MKLVTIVLAFVTGMMLQSLLHTSHVNLLSERECVRRIMQYKVAREEIITRNGSCYVEYLTKKESLR